jgi:hypothetical protein
MNDSCRLSTCSDWRSRPRGSLSRPTRHLRTACARARLVNSRRHDVWLPAKDGIGRGATDFAPRISSKNARPQNPARGYAALIKNAPPWDGPFVRWPMPRLGVALVARGRIPRCSGPIASQARTLPDPLAIGHYRDRALVITGRLEKSGREFKFSTAAGSEARTASYSDAKKHPDRHVSRSTLSGEFDAATWEGRPGAARNASGHGMAWSVRSGLEPATARISTQDCYGVVRPERRGARNRAHHRRLPN